MYITYSTQQYVGTHLGNFKAMDEYVHCFLVCIDVYYYSRGL